jgi:hypothetical protein
MINAAHDDARKAAVKQTQLSFSKFPGECPYGVQEILDDTYFPD